MADISIYKNVELERRFFADKHEWDYFLTQLGIDDPEETIQQVTITVDRVQYEPEED